MITKKKGSRDHSVVSCLLKHLVLATVGQGALGCMESLVCPCAGFNWLSGAEAIQYGVTVVGGKKCHKQLNWKYEEKYAFLAASKVSFHFVSNRPNI